MPVLTGPIHSLEAMGEGQQQTESQHNPPTVLMSLPNKTQRLLVCFGKAVNPFLTQLSKAQFVAESNPPSLPELPSCSLTALPSPDQNPTLHPTCFHCDLPDST